MDIWLIILGPAYFLGTISYIINFAFNKGFLCKTYKDVATKVGFIIFLMIDIIMVPWILICYLVYRIILLFEKIIFRKE